MQYYISPKPDDLQHKGRIGMKWGIQNGPPYPLSRATVAKVYSTSGKVGDAASKAKKLKSDLQRKSSARSRSDASSLTDQQLRDAVNRMQLEENYNRLMNSREVSRGSEFVDKALDVVGDTALLAGSIASIILLFKKAS